MFGHAKVYNFDHCRCRDTDAEPLYDYQPLGIWLRAERLEAMVTSGMGSQGEGTNLSSVHTWMNLQPGTKDKDQ